MFLAASPSKAKVDDPVFTWDGGKVIDIAPLVMLNEPAGKFVKENVPGADTV